MAFNFALMGAAGFGPPHLAFHPVSLEQILKRLAASPVTVWDEKPSYSIQTI